jgi:hypothetical protein
MNKTLIKNLRESFLDWCAALTIDEIVSNDQLIGAIELLERKLLTAIY